MILQNLTHSVVFLEANNEAIKLDFDYLNYKHDKHPIIFYMGDWDHPVTGNKLYGGINLNYLNEAERQYLRRTISLANVLKGKNLKERYWKLYHGLRKYFGYDGRINPKEFFKKSYRTYNAKYVAGQRRGNIMRIDFTDDDEALAAHLAAEDGIDYEKLPAQEKAKYIDQALEKHQQEAEAAETVEEPEPTAKVPKTQPKPPGELPEPEPPPQPGEPETLQPKQFKDLGKELLPPTEKPPAGLPPKKISPAQGVEFEQPAPKQTPKNPIDSRKIEKGIEPEE